MQKPFKRQRNNRGISIILLVFVLAILQLTIDFFVFNLVRILMIERQINGVCEAASLAGTAVLARLDVSNDDNRHKKLATAQKAACRCAENMILRGHILGRVMDKAVNCDQLADLNKNLKSDSSQYFVTIADPQSNYAPVSFGDSNGRTISCYMVYGYKPVFLGFLAGMCYPVTGNCVSGLPQVDTVVVIDCSASMDDQTPVTFVRREWIHSSLGAGNFPAGSVDPANQNSSGCGIVQYVSLICPSAPCTLANYLGWNEDAGGSSDSSETTDGCLVNVLPPQNLDKAANEPHGAITHPMYFDAFLRSHYSHYDSKIRYLPWEATQSPYVRARDYGTPPGNCDLSVGLGGNGDGFTDMSGTAVSFYHGASAACPQINAFADTTWQRNNEDYFGYQPAAPGALLQGVAQNDPIPSPDQQTFTDLVVNITDPRIASEQPLKGPDFFVGFSYTFPDDEPDILLRNQTFFFPNIGVVVEAARGNLESTPALVGGLRNGQRALIDRSVSVNGVNFDMRSIEPKDGYQRAYQRLAMLFTQPLASVLAAIDQGYLQKLHKFADCRFGSVCYSSANPLNGNSEAGIQTFGTFTDQSDKLPGQGSFYIYTSPYGDNSLSNPVYDCGVETASGLNNSPVKDGFGFGFRIPRVALDVNNENYLECVSKNKISQGDSTDGQTMNTRLNASAGSNGIYNCRTQSTRDSGEALQSAHKMFRSGKYNLDDNDRCRPAANKLIVFFTDGEPTGGIFGKEAKAMQLVAGEGNGSHAGHTCEADGIAIVAVSLNLAKGKTYNRLKEHQLMLLDDNKPESGQPGGIAWRAGHRGKYYYCNNMLQLKTAFSDITRHFSQSQR